MSTSSSRNPLELVDRYLQAVRFWLPKTRRQEDLLAELGEDLRSQIEDKESELGHALDKDEISEILKKCGAPMVVASRLGPRRHLIGPGLYPVYEFVLKMVLLWIMTNCTFSSALISLSGSPRTAMMSAKAPGATTPTSPSRSSITAAREVALWMASIGCM